MSMAKKERAYTIMITALASLRVAVEHFKAFLYRGYIRIKRNKKACKAIKISGVCLIVCLAIVAYTAVIYRVAAKQAVERYEALLAETQVEEVVEKDPYTIQLEHEASIMAKALGGLTGFNYDNEEKERIIQCVCNRVENSSYPNTIEDVLLQPGAFDFFDYSNKATLADYELCYEYINRVHTSDYLLCEDRFVFLELGDRVTLRDTLYKTSNTNYWR